MARFFGSLLKWDQVARGQVECGCAGRTGHDTNGGRNSAL